MTPNPIRGALFALALLLPLGLHAQTARVLLVGDSWADQQFSDGSHAAVFSANGAATQQVRGANTVTSGSTAADWTAPANLQRIADALAAEPSIDTVQITLGGNDFLNQWNSTLDPEQEAALGASIHQDLQLITEFVLNQRPDIEVILSFYDYPNFVDTLGGFVGLLFCRPLWDDLGQPTPLRLNTVAAVFESTYAELASQHPRIFHVSHFGQMQFTFGFPNVGIAPGDLLPPGDPTRPSPVAAMRNLSIGRDCFHLSPTGYDVLVQNLYENYFEARFDSIFRTPFE